MSGAVREASYVEFQSLLAVALSLLECTACNGSSKKRRWLFAQGFGCVPVAKLRADKLTEVELNRRKVGVAEGIALARHAAPFVA
eukprot:6187991-Pleurochrysis_carterae.AAC.3